MVAIVSSIVQLVDFTSKVVVRLNEAQSGASNLPKSPNHLETELPVLRRTLEQINEAIQAKRFPDECAAALLPTIQS